MELDPGKIAELRVKHLEMVQGVVARLAGQGATIKNYCITVTTAVCGFAISLQRPFVALLALFPSNYPLPFFRAQLLRNYPQF